MYDLEILAEEPILDWFSKGVATDENKELRKNQKVFPQMCSWVIDSLTMRRRVGLAQLGLRSNSSACVVLSDPSLLFHF